MNELEQLADMKSAQHVIIMQLALIRHQLDPSREVEDYAGEILKNKQEEQNRILNELIVGKSF